jgi:elongation factor Ts
MAEITAEIVKQLRDKTQAGMMDCKKALAETKGDMEGAIKWLREKGLSAAAKRADRVASQGVIATKKSDDGATIAMFELNAETDFVARNDKFKALLEQLLDHVLTVKPKDIAEMETQAYVGDSTKKVSDLITNAIATIGENIIARRFAVFTPVAGNTVAEYIHMNGSIGVLVEFSGTIDNVIARDVAMQIAAANPAYITRQDVPATVLASEKEIYKQQAANDGKPAAILEKIAEGKLNKFYQENCLIEQAFVKDPDKKVSAILPKDVTVVRFARFQLGA